MGEASSLCLLVAIKHIMDSGLLQFQEGFDEDG